MRIIGQQTKKRIREIKQICFYLQTMTTSRTNKKQETKNKKQKKKLLTICENRKNDCETLRRKTT